MSSLEGEGVPELQAAITQLALQQPGVQDRVPDSYHALGRAVGAAAAKFREGEPPLIPMKRFRSMAAEPAVGLVRGCGC